MEIYYLKKLVQELQSKVVLQQIDERENKVRSAKGGYIEKGGTS